MPSILSATLKPWTFSDPDWETEIVDFGIDGRSLRDILLEAYEPFLTPRCSLPEFSGMAKGSHFQSLLSGSNNPHMAARDRHFVPLLACNLCGDPRCGGVWTRIFVGKHHVNWNGFGFSNGWGNFSPIYLERLVIFERGAYESLIRPLLDDGDAGEAHDSALPG